MDIRGDDEIVVLIPSGLLAPDRVSVFVRRKRHEIAMGDRTPTELVQLQAGVDYIVEQSAAQ